MLNPRPKVDHLCHLEVDRDDDARVQRRANLPQPEHVSLGVVRLAAVHRVKHDEESDNRDVHAVQSPTRLHPALEAHVLLPLPVQLRELEAGSLAHILVQDTQRDDRERHEEDVERGHEPVVVHHLPRSRRVEIVHEESQAEGQVLVEEVGHHLADALVVVPSVHQQEPLQEPKLRERKVRGHHSLHALLPRDADADVRRLDHAHVVGAVADGQRDLTAVLDQLGHERLLQRGDAATHDGGAPAAQLQEPRREILLERERKRPAVDDEAGLDPLLRGHRLLRDASLDERRHLRLPLLVELRAGDLPVVLLLDQLLDVHDVNVHVVPDQRTRLRDVDGGVLLIPGEHPHRDPPAHHLLDRARYPVLELILDGGGADQEEVLLDDLRRRLEFLVALLEALRRLGVRHVPRVVLRLRHLPDGQTQRAQAALGVVVHVLLGHVGVLLVPVREPVVYDRVGTLAVEHDLVLGGTNDDAHALTRGVELEHVEQLVLHRADIAAARKRGFLEFHAAGGAPLEKEPESFRRDDKRALVGGLSLVADGLPGGLSLRYDGVAHSEDAEEVPDVLGVRQGPPLVVLEPDVLEVETRLNRLGGLGEDGSALPLGDGPLDLRHALAVAHARDGALEVLHAVAGQGPGLIGEHRVDHAELLVEVAGSRAKWRVRLLVVHLPVAVQKHHRLAHLDELEGDVQGDGDEVAVQDVRGEERDDANLGGVFGVKHHIRVAGVHVPVLGGHVLDPRAADDARDGSHHAQQAEHGEDDLVHPFLDGGPFRRSRAAVHHNFGVVPGVDGQADDPLRVPQRATSEEDVGRHERDLLAPTPCLPRGGQVPGAPVTRHLPGGGRHVEVTGERVQGVVRVFALHVRILPVPAQCRHIIRPGPHAVHALDAPLDLQVCLAVQVFSLHVAHAVVQTGREEHNVARERLVPHHPHQIPRPNLPPLALHQGGAVEPFRQAGVLLVILLVPGVVLHSLLRHGQTDDEHERRPDGVRLDRGDDREERDDGDGEEVQVRDPPELLVQALWEERDGRVLAGGDGVALEPEQVVGTLRCDIRGDVHHPRRRGIGSFAEAERVHAGRHLVVVLPSHQVLRRVIPIRLRRCDPSAQVPCRRRPTGRERSGLSSRGALDRCDGARTTASFTPTIYPPQGSADPSADLS